MPSSPALPPGRFENTGAGLEIIRSSFRRKPESRIVRGSWIPDRVRDDYEKQKPEKGIRFYFRIKLPVVANRPKGRTTSLLEWNGSIQDVKGFPSVPNNGP
jgi:hypothetical protein